MDFRIHIAMVLFSIAILCSVGLLSTIVKFQYDLKQHLSRFDIYHTENTPLVEDNTVNTGNLTLIVQGNELIVPIVSKESQIFRTAVDFCSKYGEEFGFTLRTSSDCIDPIISAITTIQNSGSDISSWMFEFKKPNKHDYVLEALQTDFSLDNSNSLITSSEALHSVVQDDGLESIALNINGYKYVFEFSKASLNAQNDNIAIKQTAERLATDFCRLKGIELGIISDSEAHLLYDEVIPVNGPVSRNCIRPLSDALIMKVAQKGNDRNKNIIDIQN